MQGQALARRLQVFTLDELHGDEQPVFDFAASTPGRRFHGKPGLGAGLVQEPLALLFIGFSMILRPRPLQEGS